MYSIETIYNVEAYASTLREARRSARRVETYTIGQDVYIMRLPERTRVAWRRRSPEGNGCHWYWAYVTH